MEREINVDKINEWWLWALGILASTGAWTVKMLFKRLDHMEERIEYVERTHITKDDLDESLSHIKDTNNMILQHLLKHRTTENHAKKDTQDI